MSEQAKFEAWWNEKGFNSVILRAAAWTAWMARAELETKPPADDLWVTQDRVPARVGIDEYRYASFEEDDWKPVTGDWDDFAVHGWVDHEGDTLLLRCRASQLPEVCAAEPQLNEDLPNVEQPEQWPKYYRPVKKATSLLDQKQVAYFRRETRTSGITVHTDGTTFEFNNWEGDLVPIVQITEAEAMALLKKPEPRNRDEALAMLVDEGQKLGMYGTPQPAKTRVRLFASFGALHICLPGEITEGIGREIHYDAETKQFYVEQQ